MKFKYFPFALIFYSLWLPVWTFCMAFYLSPWTSTRLRLLLIKFSWLTTPQPELQKELWTVALVLAGKSSRVPPCLLLRCLGLSSLVLRFWHNNPAVTSGSHPPDSRLSLKCSRHGDSAADCTVSTASSEKSPCLGRAFKSPEGRDSGIYCFFSYRRARPGKICIASHSWNRTF